MPHDLWVPHLDLGDGHSLRFTVWEPDPVLNPQWADLPAELPGQYHGAIIRHPVGPSPTEGAKWLHDQGFCEGGVTFDTERNRAGGQLSNKSWQVQSWDPLTISPSILCLGCGDHGFIREGRWVRA